tara:strand:+ start:345 stop:599 length:255 start_codon:yes stop_codon:yes gene_type:complete
MQSFQEYIDEFLETTKLKDLKKVHKAKKKGYIEVEIEAVSPAERRKRMQAHLKKTMKKYGDATKMGMDPAQVNQRRNRPTLKKR